MHLYQILSYSFLYFLLLSALRSVRLEAFRVEQRVQRRGKILNASHIKQPIPGELSRTMCMRAWQTDTYFPPKQYSSFTVRRPAGLTLDELNFAAVRRVRVPKVKGDFSGSLENGILRVSAGGKLSCNHVGPPKNSPITCGQMQVVLVDLDLKGESMMDNLALPGENVISVAFRLKVSVFNRKLRTDELNVKVLELGDGFLSNKILRRVMNAGIVHSLIKQALSVNLLSLMHQTPLLEFVPKLEFSGSLQPPETDCDVGYSCFNVVGASIVMEVSTEDLLKVDMHSKVRLASPEFLLSMPLVALSLELPILLSKGLSRFGMHSTIGLSPSDSSSDLMLGFRVNGDFGLSLVQVLERARELMDLRAHPAFAAKHSEDVERLQESSAQPTLNWFNLGLFDPSIGSLTSLAFKGLQASLEGRLIIENLHVWRRRDAAAHKSSIIKVQARGLNVDMNVDSFDCSVAETYLQKWVDRADWPGLDVCSFLGDSLNIGFTGNFDAIFDPATGRVSVCLNSPCGNRLDMEAPEVGLLLKSSTIPRLHVYPSGQWSVSVDSLAILAALRNTIRELALLEAERGPTPVADEVALSLKDALESVECFGAGPLASLSRMASQKIFDNMMGKNIQWTPSPQRLREDEATFRKLEEEFALSDSSRYVIGRMNPQHGRVFGTIDATGWDDEEIALDSVLRIRAATHDALRQLGLGPDEGDYIVTLRGPQGGFANPSIGLLNPRSTDSELSNLFSWVSAAHGNSSDRLFKVILGFKLTFVLKDQKLIGCLPKVGGCCSKSVQLETPVFVGGTLWTGLANRLGSLGDSLFGSFLKDLLGHGLPKFLQPVIQKSLGSVGVNDNDEFRSLTLQLHVESKLGEKHININIDPVLKSNEDRRKFERKLSRERLKIADKVQVSLDAGLLQLDSKPAALLAKTLLGRLEMDSFGSTSFPFKATLDKNLYLRGEVPTAASSLPYGSLLSNLREASGQPKQYWEHVAFESGLILPSAVAEVLEGDTCKLRRPIHSRKQNREIDYSRLIDFSGFRSIQSDFEVKVRKLADEIHKVTVDLKTTSVKVDLDKTLPMITNDPGATEFYYTDYDAGKFLVDGYEQNVYLRCGSVAFGDTIHDGLLVGMTTRDLKVSYELASGEVGTWNGESWYVTCVNVGTRKVGTWRVCGEDGRLTQFIDVLRDEIELQSVNAAKRADPKCEDVSMAPEETTAFGAMDAHRSEAYSWRGVIGNLSESRFRDILPKDIAGLAREAKFCQTSCGAHAACANTDLVVFRHDDEPYPVCEYSSVPRSSGLNKQWHVK